MWKVFQIGLIRTTSKLSRHKLTSPTYLRAPASHVRKQTNEMMQITYKWQVLGERKTGLLIELRAVDTQTGWSSRGTADGVRRISGT